MSASHTVWLLLNPDSKQRKNIFSSSHENINTNRIFYYFKELIKNTRSDDDKMIIFLKRSLYLLQKNAEIFVGKIIGWLGFLSRQSEKGEWVK